MKTIVLAAGLSKRLGELTKEKPKCLLEVGNTTIFERTIQACAQLKLNDLVIVTGHGADYIDRQLSEIRCRSWASDLKIVPVFNAKYATINNCYSLLLGLPQKEQPVIIINSDDIFDSRILKGISAEGPTRLVIDNVKQLTEESMKVYMNNDRICRISKALDIQTSAGEYIGLAQIAGKDISQLRTLLEEVVADNPNGFYENAFDLMFERTEIYPWFTDGLQWTEIDTKEDLDFAMSLVKGDTLK